MSNFNQQRLETFFNSIPFKYIPLIAADFAEEVIPIYEAYNKDSSVLVEAIAAARSGDPVRARAAADAAYAVYTAAASADAYTAADAAIAGHYAANAANAATAHAAYTAVADAAVNAVYTAAYAISAAVYIAANASISKAKAEKRQIEIIKSWIVKMKTEEPILMAFYDTIDFE